MKYLLYAILVFAVFACKEDVAPKHEEMASQPIIDTFRNNTPKAETANSTYIEDELIGEFAIINDKDGYTYIRDTPAKTGKIQHKLDNRTFVFCMEAIGEWVGVDYYYNDPNMKNFLHGFIHKSRLLFIGTYPAVTGLTQQNNSVVIGDDKFNITVTQEPFNKTKHQLMFDPEHNYLQTIDGRHIWGTDGNVPARQYKTVEINLGEKHIEIPTGALESLYEPNLNNTEANYDKEKDVLYIYSSNSDGAGGCSIIWRIEEGIYKDRFVFYGF